MILQCFHKFHSITLWFRPLDLVNYQLFADRGFEKIVIWH